MKIEKIGTNILWRCVAFHQKPALKQTLLWQILKINHDISAKSIRVSATRLKSTKTKMSRETLQHRQHMQDLSSLQDICFQELPHRSKARMYNVHSHYAQLRFISVTLHCLWATFGWSLMAIVSADPSLYTRVGFHCMPPQSQARGIQSYMIARIIIIKQPAWLSGFTWS